jgi:TonB family protein
MSHRARVMRNDAMNFSLIVSLLIHTVVMAFVSLLLKHPSHAPSQNLIRVGLIEPTRTEKSNAMTREEIRSEIKEPAPQRKVDKISDRPLEKTIARVPPQQFAAPSAPTEEQTVKTETSLSFASGTQVHGGGSEAGAGELFGKGDGGIVSGAGTVGGGGGTAASGLGRGSGIPGLPAQALRTNREAKPIQTVKAAYPPMALRAGLESDVTLKIEVDPQGNVTKAEIIKGGGAGFDEEALKAVRQSRFEPAQRDGQSVAAEFTYIYRFRLQR